MNVIEGRVRERLKALRLSDPEREEVFAEIAAHLECVAKELRTNGAGERQAVQMALSQLNDTDRILKGIQRERTREMRDSFRKVWLPAAVVLFLVYASQMIIYRLVPEPRTYRIMGNYYAYSWGWLLMVVVCGALGAWWSREAGGSVRDRIVVALAPAETMAVVIAILLPLDAIVQISMEHRTPYFLSHKQMVLATLLWLLHTAIPSLIGAAPLLRAGRVQAKELPS